MRVLRALVRLLEPIVIIAHSELVYCDVPVLCCAVIVSHAHVTVGVIYAFDIRSLTVLPSSPTLPTSWRAPRRRA